MSKLWVILSACLLAGCSTTCQPRRTASFEAPVLRATPLASPPRIAKPLTRAALPKPANTAKLASTARAQAPEAGVDQTSSTPSGPPQFDPRGYGPKIKPTTDFMIANPNLFSATEDQRPWPITNSPEGAERQKDDARREKEISRAIQICRC